MLWGGIYVLGREGLSRSVGSQSVSQSVTKHPPIGQSLNVSEKQPGNYQTPGCPDFSHDCHQGPAVILERRKQRVDPCCSIEEKTTPVVYGCVYGCIYVGLGC